MGRWLCLPIVCLSVCVALQTATVSAEDEETSHNITIRSSPRYRMSTTSRLPSSRITLLPRSRPFRAPSKSRNRNIQIRTSRRSRWRYPTGVRGLFSPSARVRIPGNSVSSRVRGRKKVMTWDYTPLHGPARWPSMYPACSGSRQSPINIQTSNVSFRGFKGVTLINLQPQTSACSVSFDGYTVKLRPSGRLYVRDVGVPGQTYTVGDIHLHWSSRNRHGSEHAVDGVLFPLEMHILCYLSKYNSIETAKGRKNGLAVLAVIFDIGTPNKALWPVIGATDVLYDKDDEVPVRGLDLRQLLPARMDHFFRYRGSMTTPPCTENVIWTVFEHLQTLSHEQFRVFQDLRRGRLASDRDVFDNSRPVQSVNSRTVISTNAVFSHSTAPLG